MPTGRARPARPRASSSTISPHVPAPANIARSAPVSPAATTRCWPKRITASAWSPRSADRPPPACSRCTAHRCTSTRWAVSCANMAPTRFRWHRWTTCWTAKIRCSPGSRRSCDNRAARDFVHVSDSWRRVTYAVVDNLEPDLMTLGSDVSALATTAASAAAAQGLSIVVPLYNEAAGLALLHERLIGLARTLRQRYGLACEVIYVDDGSADSTLAIARGLQGRCARRSGGVAVAQFRQGSSFDGRTGSCKARRGPVHGWRRPAPADPGRETGRSLDRRRLRRRLYGESQSRQ